MLTLTALVLASLHPATPVTSTALAQQKIQIIKGKKGTGTVKNGASVETGTQKVAPDNRRAEELEAKAADLDAKAQELDQREQAINEKQAANEESEKKKAEQLKAQQKQLEKINAGTQKLWQQSSDALAGD